VPLYDLHGAGLFNLALRLYPLRGLFEGQPAVRDLAGGALGVVGRLVAHLFVAVSKLAEDRCVGVVEDVERFCGHVLLSFRFFSFGELAVSLGRGFAWRVWAG